MSRLAGVWGFVMLNLINWRIYAYGALAALALSSTTYLIGHRNGTFSCNEKHLAAANKSGLAQLDTDLKAVQTQANTATAAGTALAKTEQSTNARTTKLTNEVIKNAPIYTHTDCKPNADVVRAWNAANSNPDLAPTTPTQRDDKLP